MVLGSKFAKKNLDHYKNVYEDTDSRIQAWINLFFVWKGSVTKLLWMDLLVRPPNVFGGLKISELLEGGME